MPSLAVALRRRWPWALAVGLLVAFAISLPELRRPAAVHRASAGLLIGDLREVTSYEPAALVTSDEVGQLAAAYLVRVPDGKGLERSDLELLTALQEGKTDLKDVVALRDRVRIGYADGRVTASAGDGGTAVKAANAWARFGLLYLRTLPLAMKEEREKQLPALRVRVEALELQAGPAERRREEALRRVDALDDAETELLRRVEESRAAQDRAMARIKSIELLEHRLREALPAGVEENGITSPLLDRLRQERESIRAEIAIKKLERTPEAPEAVKLQGRLSDVVEEIRKELFAARDATIVKLRNSIDALEAERRQLDERRLRLSLDRREAQEEIGRRDPELEELSALRRQLKEDEEKVRRLAGAEAPVTLGEPADRAESRGGARSGVLLAGIGAGLLAGLGTALLLQALDRRVRTVADIRRAMGLPTIARVPGLAEPFLLRAPVDDEGAKVFSLGAGVLRSYLEEREFRSVLVAATTGGEGATTCAADLAVGLARKGLSVAVVDADLRGQRLSALFGADPSWGLASVLRGEEVPAELPTPALELPNLRLVPAGASSELGPESLESGRFIEFLRILRERHEVVVVDAPPIREGGETVTLAGLVDTVVWVGLAGRWTEGGLAWTRDLFRNVRADVAGAILNFAPPDGDEAS